MKKLFALFIVCVCLLFMQHSFSLSSVSKNLCGTHTFFTTENFSCENVNTQKNGSGFLIFCESKNAEQIFKQLNKSKLDGECFCTETKNFNINQFLKITNAKIVKQEKFSNLYITYAYSPKIFDYVLVENKKINLQIAQNAKKTTVGTPLILGSF